LLAIDDQKALRADLDRYASLPDLARLIVAHEKVAHGPDARAALEMARRTCAEPTRSWPRTGSGRAARGRAHPRAAARACRRRARRPAATSRETSPRPRAGRPRRST